MDDLVPKPPYSPGEQLKAQGRIFRGLTTRGTTKLERISKIVISGICFISGAVLLAVVDTFGINNVKGGYIFSFIFLNLFVVALVYLFGRSLYINLRPARMNKSNKQI